MVFTRWPREDSFPTSFPGFSPTRPCRATVRRENLEMRLYSFPVSRALGGKYRRLSRFAIFFYRIWHRFMSILRGVRICWVFVGGNTVNYNHISFLNTRSQLVWVLASSGFYSITWRMISRSAGYKIHFRKQPPFGGNLCPSSVLYLSFLWIYAPWQFVHGSLGFIQSNN